ncbi:unnamed protein product [Pelagomonas calceolata]|uniref:Uncharacterized protein n=1 Tax=Pelagomonas calceolata TaxID=35677 RepID=A0A8J2S715_9STRA|nr:unnamed protein product [Pelagomonas calceolata]
MASTAAVLKSISSVMLMFARSAVSLTVKSVGKRWHSEHPLVGITPRSNSVPLAASPLACCKTLAK